MDSDRLADARAAARQVAHVVAYSTGATGLSLQQAFGALALDALTTYRNATGKPIPELAARIGAHSQLVTSAASLQRDWFRESSPTERARYLPLLTYEFADLWSGFESLSSESIVTVTVAATLSQVQPGQGTVVVTDFAAGAGATLLGVGTALRELGYSPILRGLEINEWVAGLATAVLTIAGFDPDIRVGNSLTDKAFRADKSDITLAQPPFGLHVQDADGVRARHGQGWYQLGIPRITDATWLFAQRVIEGLGGTAGIDRGVCFVGSGALQGPSSSAVRESLLERGLLAAVVALPEGLTQASVPTFALVFNGPQPERPSSHVRAVDLRGASQATTRREIRRQLSPDAEETLRRALNSKRDGPSWRSVPPTHFLNRKIHVRSSSTPDSEGWDVDLPRDDPELAIQTRYGPIAVAIDRAGDTTCDIAVAPLFDRAADAPRRWILKNGWAATRLSALLTRAPRVAQPHSASDASSSSIVLPTTPTLPASTLEEASTDGTARRLHLELDTRRVDPDFVVAWLNSDDGLVVRAKAVAAASAGSVVRAVRSEPRQLWRLCDEMLVPLPPSEVQREIVRAESRIGTAVAMLDDSRQEVWDNPASAMDVARRVESLLDKSLETWATDLPFPIASALWAFRTKQDLHGAHRHVFHVWEAYTTFLATVLLSALAQDPVRETDQRDKLTRRLRTANQTLDRATFGCWVTIVQSLSSDFRTRLTSGDADDSTAVLTAFGGTTRYSLERVLSARSVALIADANNHRNTWSGHAGASTDAEIREQTAYMTEGLERLREITGNAWVDLPVVRAGHAALRDDVLVQRAELVRGTSVPFRQVDLQVGQMMKSEQLYICNDGAAQPLPLKHSVVLRSSPDTAQYTSYFYSRLEGNEVRLVTYALAEASERFEPSTELPMDFIA